MLPATKMVLRQVQKSVYLEKVVTGDTNVLQSHTDRDRRQRSDGPNRRHGGGSAIKQLPQVLSLDRRAVRRRFEQRFSVTRMEKDYIQIYRSLMKRPLTAIRTSALYARS
jgi:hypothetical protein